MAAQPELWVCHMGVVPYDEALALQRALRDARQDGLIPDTLLLLEHPPVYTRGRHSAPASLQRGKQWYREQGFDIVDVDRGGQVTMHNPGMLTGYTIMGIDRVPAFLEKLENGLIAALRDEGVAAEHHDSTPGRNLTGVWVGPRKIASIGLHISRGVTMHGFAVNVENDLDPFTWIVACGLGDVAMTSVARATDREGDALLPCFRKRAAFRVAEAFGLRQRLVSRERLEAALAAAPAA